MPVQSFLTFLFFGRLRLPSEASSLSIAEAPFLAFFDRFLATWSVPIFRSRPLTMH